MDNKEHRYEQLAIPTYEEATSSRPSSSQSRVGPEEISDDAERQVLLGLHADREASRRNNYAPPTVESERSSLDSLDGLEDDDGANEVRREMQEMDMEDVQHGHNSHRLLLGSRFKRFTKFTSSFTNLSLPSLGRFMPSFHWPKINWETMDANRVVIIGRLVGVLLIAGFLYLVIASDILQIGRNRWGRGNIYPPEQLRAYLQNAFHDRSEMRNNLEHITRFPHIAGSEGSYVLGEWIREIFKTAGLDDIKMDRYEVYMNFPTADGRKVTLGDWTAALEETEEQTPVFHGLSKTGEVTGPLVYANFGSQDDFRKLQDNGIDIKGSVVLVRHYGTQEDPGLKVRAAQDAGAVGCIIYSDPAQDGSVQGPEFPEGRYMPKSGVQRGSVGMMSRVIGDVLSPGWAAVPKTPNRLEPEESSGLNSIPSIPISWTDASHLLAQLHGHGKQMDGDWTGAPETEYWTGDQGSPSVTLKNDQNEERYQPVYNVIGLMVGWEKPEKRVIVGSHRDSWCLGAASPGSGTAVLLALVKIFGEMQAMGWRPLRTIEFVSWDAGEFNAAGSTEYVENYIDELRRNGIAYINVDAGVTGADFHASASPVFEASLRRILNRVTDPYSNNTLRDVWEEHNTGITPLVAEGDCTPFQFIGGTSSIDLKFKGAHYPQNSCSDSLEWMNKFGEPNGAYDYAAALGQVWGLLILELADSPLLQFDMRSYHQTLHKYTDLLQMILDEYKKEDPTNQDLSSVTLENLRIFIDFLDSQINLLAIWDSRWHDTVFNAGGYETSSLTIKRVDRNNRLANFETRLLDLYNSKSNSNAAEGPSENGLPERTQYKHVITAPGWWDSRTSESFPGIRYWMEKKDWTKVKIEIEKVANIIRIAAMELSVASIS